MTTGIENGFRVMQIDGFLAEDDCLVGSIADTKNRLLNALCSRAASHLRLDPDKLSAAILKREELGSTGIGGGVAVPHARIAELKKPFGVLARLEKPIDFSAIDGELVDVVFLLLLPPSSSGIHLNALAAVARKLRDATALKAIRRARDSASLHRAMTSA